MKSVDVTARQDAAILNAMKDSGGWVFLEALKERLSGCSDFSSDPSARDNEVKSTLITLELEQKIEYAHDNRGVRFRLKESHTPAPARIAGDLLAEESFEDEAPAPVSDQAHWSADTESRYPPAVIEPAEIPPKAEPAAPGSIVNDFEPIFSDGYPDGYGYVVAFDRGIFGVKGFYQDRLIWSAGFGMKTAAIVAGDQWLHDAIKRGPPNDTAQGPRPEWPRQRLVWKTSDGKAWDEESEAAGHQHNLEQKAMINEFLDQHEGRFEWAHHRIDILSAILAWEAHKARHTETPT